MDASAAIPDPAAVERAGRRIRRRIRALEVLSAIVWVAAAAAVTRLHLPPPVRIAIAFSPSIPLAWCALAFWRARKHLDEFGRRVLIEGAAFAFAALLPALLIYVMTQNADIGAPEVGPAIVFVYALIAYAVGVWFALRRRP